ncbi:MFS transporter [Arthrobacter sp. H35-D1]|uniref:MFS transporter n=1 Tax=Arthrobacter sp. H35-D1 TaxID=3046202 RepID=UPI0024B8D854|nr:MFS transporter [Arthrobacter sp. H35-D1]MDJ0314817.1 MFS transporter [Arthrobacter sp. H35-D1]
MPITAPLATYAAVFRLPHVPFVFATALAARFAYPLVTLPLLLAVQSATASFSAAGLAMGFYGATAGFLAPLRARAVDRHGRRRALSGFAVLFALSLATLALATSLNAPVIMCVGAAALAGAVAPPIGPSMRVMWASMTPTNVLLKKALSVDSVLEELLYLAGPALAGFVLLVISPSAALLLPASLVLIGTLLMLSSPAARERREPGAHNDSPVSEQSLLKQRRFLALLLPVLATGLVVGTIYVTVPAAIQGPHSEAAIGIVLAVFAAGSVVGGLLYGASQPKMSAHKQLLALTTLLTLATAAVMAAHTVLSLGLVLLVAGVFLSPTMIVAYFAANGFGGTTRQNAATTWVNTSHNVGAAAGSVCAGILIESAGTNEAILVALCGSAAILAISGAIPTLRRRPSPFRS